MQSITNKDKKKMDVTKSIRSRLIALQPGGRLMFPVAKENTIRNTASIIANLSGKKFRVKKGTDSIMVYRYE